MKKLFSVCLIGLSFTSETKCQNLNVSNTSICNFNFSAGETNSLTCATATAISASLPAGSSATYTFSGAPYFVNKFYISDACISKALYDYTSCGGSSNLTVTLAPNACCPVTINVQLITGSPTTNTIFNVW